MEQKNQKSSYEYEVVIDILAEMVSNYITNQSKGAEPNEKQD
ncbi:hypothetical protein PD280_07390 [Virgibacillus salarius]|nr:hypothetical protein [Virgibacillus salarius]WBX81515.1 hypothetical protein PD280_07390 [Virgibacillus salarius]